MNKELEDKLRSQSDGVEDCTETIQEIINAQSTVVVIPEGVYSVSSTIEVR